MDQDFHCRPNADVLKKTVIGRQEYGWEGRPLVGVKFRVIRNRKYLRPGNTQMRSIGTKTGHAKDRGAFSKVGHVTAALDDRVCRALEAD